MKLFSVISTLGFSAVCALAGSAATGTGSQLDAATFGQHLSLELVQKLSQFLDSNSPDSDATNLGKVRLSDLGLVPELGSDMELSDLAERVKVKLSDKYEFDFKQPSSDDGTILGIQFSSMFELPPRSIKYVATMLESLAQVGAESAKAIAPVVGLNKAGFGSPANTASVANLIKAVGMLGSDMLGYIADTTKQPSTDPVIQNNAMFRLSDLMRIAPERVNHVTKIILGLGNTDAATAKKFLKDLSWVGANNSPTQQRSASMTPAMPSLDYLFTISDSVLENISAALQLYVQGDKSKVYELAPYINDIFSNSSVFWKSASGHRIVGAAPGVQRASAINFLLDMISLSYRYPDMSVWGLALKYYESIGMPGLSAASGMASQFAGNAVSAIVGGFVSEQLNSILGSLLNTVIDGPTMASGTPATTKSASSASSQKPATPTPSSARTASTSTSGWWWGAGPLPSGLPPNIFPTPAPTHAAGTSDKERQTPSADNAVTVSKFALPGIGATPADPLAPNGAEPSITIGFITLPDITLPTFTRPTFTLPTFTLPTFTLPTFTLPTFTRPTFTRPTFTMPPWLSSLSSGVSSYRHRSDTKTSTPTPTVSAPPAATPTPSATSTASSSSSSSASATSSGTSSSSSASATDSGASSSSSASATDSSASSSSSASTSATDSSASSSSSASATDSSASSSSSASATDSSASRSSSASATDSSVSNSSSASATDSSASNSSSASATDSSASSPSSASATDSSATSSSSASATDSSASSSSSASATDSSASSLSSASATDSSVSNSSSASATDSSASRSSSASVTDSSASNSSSPSATDSSVISSSSASATDSSASSSSSALATDSSASSSSASTTSTTPALPAPVIIPTDSTIPLTTSTLGATPGVINAIPAPPATRTIVNPNQTKMTVVISVRTNIPRPTPRPMSPPAIITRKSAVTWVPYGTSKPASVLNGIAPSLPEHYNAPALTMMLTYQSNPYPAVSTAITFQEAEATVN